MDVLAELRRDDRLVIEGLREGARRHGDRPLMVAEESGTTLSYGDFDEAVRRVAGGFLRLGLATGDRVAVFTRDPVTAATAMFAAWRAGLIYTPVNFNLTAGTLAYQLADARVGVVVCERALLAALAEVSDALTTACVVIDGDGPAEVPARLPAGRRVLTWAELADGPASEPAVSRMPSDPANIIYTSGTTGRPKGVVQPFRWMNQYTFFVRRMIGPGDVVYNDLPLYHVGGAIFNVARAVWAGATVAVWQKFSSHDFWGRVRRTEATTAVLLDVMIPWLMNEPAAPADADNSLTMVHMQPLPAYHHAFAERFGVPFVTAGFGQTETGCSYFGVIDEAPGRDDPWHRKILDLLAGFGAPVMKGDAPIGKGFMGRPAPFMEVAVLDEMDEPVEGDGTGELAVRPRLPHLLLREYFGRPDATAAATRNLWFHTGDLVRRTGDGHAYFVDRVGDRIRTRGENISSAQLEDLLNGMPGVAVSAVVPVAGADSLEHDIAAFVVPVDDEQGGTLSEQEVLDWAQENVPRFMRPRYVRVIPELPRTPTNKIEKYRLRARIAEELGREHASG
ncbi:class I adenylate-forming enzyme family protein [Actinomadura rugatobispora]|uniref:Class I adenylate-forming enzyme family protein n=1 Tax=Actinomadura rugatobispora TaxID=1994 RepID=A0ABW0ZVD6_9ACTN|nr:AMP-binding protein [Actinomadura rugatobispora]